MSVVGRFGDPADDQHRVLRTAASHRDTERAHIRWSHQPRCPCWRTKKTCGRARQRERAQPATFCAPRVRGFLRARPSARVSANEAFSTALPMPDAAAQLRQQASSRPYRCVSERDPRRAGGQRPDLDVDESTPSPSAAVRVFPQNRTRAPQWPRRVCPQTSLHE